MDLRLRALKAKQLLIQSKFVTLAKAGMTDLFMDFLAAYS
jgi:hypothetical protein